MRFLLDECISARLAPLVAEAGHDVVHVSDRGLAGHVDEEVLAAARDEERVLVSADTDFGELLAKQGLALPSLVLFRQGNRGPEHQAATLLDNLDYVAEDLAAGAIVVFTDDTSGFECPSGELRAIRAHPSDGPPPVTAEERPGGYRTTATLTRRKLRGPSCCSPPGRGDAAQGGFEVVEADADGPSAALVGGDGAVGDPAANGPDR